MYASVCMSYRVSIRCACYLTEKENGNQQFLSLPTAVPFLHSEKHYTRSFYTNIAKNINIFFTIFNYTKQKYRSQGHTEEDRKIYIYVVILQVKMVDYGVMSECPRT